MKKFFNDIIDHIKAHNVTLSKEFKFNNFKHCKNIAPITGEDSFYIKFDNGYHELNFSINKDQYYYLIENKRELLEYLNN